MKCFFSVGYTMADIRYKWNDGLNSVQVSGDVSLPQFKVLGHRQKTIEASLSTGQKNIYHVHKEWKVWYFLNKSMKSWSNYTRESFEICSFPKLSLILNYDKTISSEK